MDLGKVEILKQEIDDAKAEKARLEGELSGLLKRLQKEFGVISVDAARKKLVELQKESSQLEKKINKRLKLLEDKLDEFGIEI